MRTSPCFQEGSILENYNQIIRESLIEILNIKLTETSWNQASLPISKGGLGLRPAMEVALAGFLSNLCASDKLIKGLLPQNSSLQMMQSNKAFDSAVLKWKELSGLTSLPMNKIFQSEWNRGLYEFRYKNLLLQIQDETETARILSVSSQSSSDWLYSVPIPSLGLHLHPMTLKIACGLRLGSVICHPYKRVCGKMMHSLGRHGLVCKN